MAEWLTFQPLDQKVHGSILGSNLLCSCHSGGPNGHIQAYENHFQRLQFRLSDETLNQDAGSLS